VVNSVRRHAKTKDTNEAVNTLRYCVAFSPASVVSRSAGAFRFSRSDSSSLFAIGASCHPLDFTISLLLKKREMCVVSLPGSK
jgi:hypothetical protein